MTATQKKPNRRTFLKGVAAVPIGAAGIGAMSAPAAAQVDEDRDLGWRQDTIGAGASYLVRRVEDHFSGLGDDDDYQEEQAESIYSFARADVRAFESGNDSVLTTLENLIENAKSVGYQIGRSKFLEMLNEGESPTNAWIDGREEIRGYFAPNQKNLIERWEVIVSRMELQEDRADALEMDPLYRFPSRSSNADYGDARFEDATITLVDDSEVDWTYVRTSAPYYDMLREGLYPFPTGNDEEYPEDIEFRGRFDYDPIFGATQADRFRTVWEDLEAACSDAIDELEEFYQGIQDDYVAGDIDTGDLVTPRDLWEMSSDDSDNPYSAADLSGLGLEINQDSSVVVELLDEEEIIEGDVYLSQSPIGESLEVGKVYDPDLSRSTEDGEPDDSIDDYDGDPDDPIPIDGLAYIAFNTDDGSTYGEIGQPFTVVEAFDSDGEELENVTYEPSTGQQTTSTDIDEFRDELEAMNDELIRVEEERAELAGGGGGGLFGDTNNTVVAAVAAVAGIWVLFGGDS